MACLRHITLGINNRGGKDLVICIPLFISLLIAVGPGSFATIGYISLAYARDLLVIIFRSGQQC